MTVPTETLAAKARKLYNPALAVAAQKGIPASVEHKAVPQTAHETIKLANGIVVSKIKYAKFEQTLADFGKRVADRPRDLHKITQDLGEWLLKMHLDDVREGCEQQAAEWSKTRAGWRDEFAKDSELGKNRRDTTLKRAKGLLAQYGKSVGADRLEKLRDILAHTGAGDHVEVLRFVNWAASHMPASARK